MGTDLHRRFVLVVLCCGRPMVAPTQKHAPVAAHDDMRQHTHKAACTHAFRRPVEPLGGSKTGGAHIGAARLAAEVSGHYGAGAMAGCASTHTVACTHAFGWPVEPLGGSKTGGAHIGAARLAAEVSGHYGRRNDGSGREKRGGRMAAPRGVGITLRDRDTGR